MTRVKALRAHLGLSQAALGSRIGLSQAAVARLEAGARESGPVQRLLDLLAAERGFAWPRPVAPAETCSA